MGRKSFSFLEPAVIAEFRRQIGDDGGDDDSSDAAGDH
jgi:hypothetical protein